MRNLCALILILFLSCETRAASWYTLTQDDDQFLDRLERAHFLYFWEQADANSGQVRDRAVVTGVNETRPEASIASTGFGLTALCIAHSRGYMDKSTIETRVYNTLNFVLNNLDGANGFYYHFVQIQTGKRYWNCELSSIDTAMLVNGAILVREYFKNINTTLRDMAQSIYDRVNYRWLFNNTSGFMSMGWTPEKGIFTGNAVWDRYSELMMLILQAVGANSSNAIPASAWNQFARPTLTYKGITYITSNDPLFIHQYSHAWYDFRGRRDSYADYFENSIKATRVHKQWSLDVLAPKFADYTDNQWGVTASDSAKSYIVWGGPTLSGGQVDGNIDGTIVPCAPSGSLVFLPNETLAVLKHINATYPQVWHRYGFRDAFNPLTNWYNPDVLGIDIGATLLMAENLRTGFVWNYMMQNAQIRKAMDMVGLKVYFNPVNTNLPYPLFNGASELSILYLIYSTLSIVFGGYFLNSYLVLDL